MTSPPHLSTEWDELDPRDELSAEPEPVDVADCDDPGPSGADADDQTSSHSEDRPTTPAHGELAFDCLERWVEGYLMDFYRRAVSGTATTWCPEWWRHPEAVLRLEALWRAWEYLQREPTTGMSVWFRDHCDHHMPLLLSADGPFRGCKPSRHRRELDRLPATPPPAGWQSPTGRQQPASERR